MTVIASGYALQGRTVNGIRRAGRRRRRSVSDPARDADDDPGLRRGNRRRHGRRGARGEIDLWFPTTAQALQWGRRTVTSRSADNSGALTRSLETPRLARPPGRGSAEGQRTIDETEPQALRVLLVDDHDLFRTGLRNLLEEQGVDIVGRRPAAPRLRFVRELAPDVVVMDLNMPGMSGVEATRHISRDAPLTRVIVLTISDQEQDVMDAILAGACGYLLKDASIQELMRGLEAAAIGESLIPRTSRGRCSSTCGDTRRRRRPRDPRGALRPRDRGAQADRERQGQREDRRDSTSARKWSKTTSRTSS